MVRIGIDLREVHRVAFGVHVVEHLVGVRWVGVRLVDIELISGWVELPIPLILIVLGVRMIVQASTWHVSFLRDDVACLIWVSCCPPV